MNHKTFSPRSRRSNLVVQEFSNEILIYDLDVNKAFSLNQTSAMVWNLCDGTNTVADIAQVMTAKLGSIVTEDFVWLALDQLRKDNLLEDNSVLQIPFDGLSRRDVIRRAGLASLVALPVIATLIAPTAVNAASGCTGVGNTGNINGCACSSNGNCTSGCCGSNGSSNACVAQNSEPNGSICRAGCECASICCVNNICASNTGANGTACTTGCQCAGGCCANGVCAVDTVPSGGACSLSCQCVGNSTCSNGVCT